MSAAIQSPSNGKENCKSMEQYREMYDKSVKDPAGFWADIAEQNFHWETPFPRSSVFDYNFHRSRGSISTNWFRGGRTNICYNALDRHVENGLGDRVCFYWVGNRSEDKETFTYAQVLERVCALAAVMRDEYGIKKGDRVCLYLPMTIDLPVAMLACARLGAIHSVVFGGFSGHALAQRVDDSKSRLVITANGVYRGNKWIPLKGMTDEALSEHATHQPDCGVLVVNRHPEVEVKMMEGRDVWYEEKVKPVDPKSCAVEWVDAEDPLFMLYTSGSTGTPKGVLHTTGGYMVYTATTFKYTFDYHSTGSDVFWCTADCGWITGHSYLTYGPLLCAATSVLFEGVPTFPHQGRLWEVVEEYKVTQFYTAPTAIRALQRFGTEPVEKFCRDSLRVLGTVGEPINPSAWEWYYEVVGNSKCPIVDTYWQTETGGHMLTPLPGITPMKPGSATLPFFGVQPVLLTKEGQEIEGPGEGYLVIKHPWPSMLRTVYGNQTRFEMGYFGMFDGYYVTGDGARRDEDGYYWITGRIDDVINVSGHRLGTAEVESALNRHEAVVESAVVAYPHDVKGEGIYAYVTLRPGHAFSPELAKALKMHIREEIGAFAQPDFIHEAPGLPKTRSGKIMRRILRKISTAEESQLGDVSTLADPNVVEVLITTREKKV